MSPIPPPTHTYVYTHYHTNQDSLKTEENMKRELKVRLALAGFLKDTLTEITNKKVGAFWVFGGVLGVGRGF